MPRERDLGEGAAHQRAESPGAFYSVFGLTLRSEIPLPDLFGVPPTAAIDVEIRRGPVERLGPEPPGLSLDRRGALLNISGVGRYLMRDGGEMIVDPAPDASDRNIRLYLLGSAFGAILHQRNLLPLHANAIVIGGQAVAFMGHSGAGKSTIAAWFYDHGYPILADDVCVVTFGPNGPMAHPGIPRLRLWKQALEGSGRDFRDFDRSFGSDDKFDVPTLNAAAPPKALPLSRIYLLKRGPQAQGAVEVRQLEGIEAVDAMVANTYRGSYVGMMGSTRQHLQQCLSLLRTAPVFSAERAWRFDCLDAQARALAAHASELSTRNLTLLF